MRLHSTVIVISMTLISLLASCDSGSNNTDSCDPFLTAFSPIPECVTEYFLENPTTCLCEGEVFVFGFNLQSSEADGNTGSIMGDEITWEPTSCSSISFTGQSSGVLEDMTVPEEDVLELTMIIDGSEPQQASCCCTDFIIVE